MLIISPQPAFLLLPRAIAELLFAGEEVIVVVTVLVACRQGGAKLWHHHDDRHRTLVLALCSIHHTISFTGNGVSEEESLRSPHPLHAFNYSYTSLCGGIHL